LKIDLFADVRTAGALLLLTLAGAALAPSAHAQEQATPARAEAAAGGGTLSAHLAAAPLLHTVRLTGSIQLDGRLDEVEWRTVTPATQFIQTEPHDGEPGTERTEVYILHDSDALYIGARLYDSSGGVRSRLGRRDSQLADSDWFYVMLDSHHDHVSAYQFSVNPAGVKRDERTGGDTSWDAVWDVATRVDAEGWTVEMRIPFSQLRFGSADEQTWGLQLSRRVNRKQEVTVLSHTPKGQPGGVPRYAHLTGLRELRAGRPFELQPYLMTRAEYTQVAAGNPYRDGSDYGAGAGLDVKYRVTSSLTVDATLNPDFGQVEQDPAVVNLSAFETSLSERRLFFIEGRDVFAFGNTGGFDQRGLFYSRRIGRSPQGGLPAGVAFADRPDAATILGAAKLSGRTAGGLSIGLLAAATDEESASWLKHDGTRGETVVEPRSTYLVSRLRQDLHGGDTKIGGIATFMHRQLGDEPLRDVLRSSALAGGLDFDHRFLGRTWSVEGYATFSHVLGSTGSLLRTQLASSRYFARPDARRLDLDSTRTSLTGYSARFEVGKRAGDHWRGEASVSTVSPGYEVNDAGFQTTVDRITGNANITYVENRRGTLFRNWRVTLSGTTDRNYDGDLLTARSSLNLNGQLINYWGGSLNFIRSIDTWDDRLTRGGPVTRDVGGYHVSGNISSDSRSTVSGRINSSYSRNRAGGWNNGNSINVNLRPADWWTVSAGPRIDRSRSMAQYITSVAAPDMTATYGRRYLFSQLSQTTLSVETRLNVNFSPDLSFELFAQPFVSSGDFSEPAQLRAARTYEFDVFGRDVGTLAYDADDRIYTIDPDGAGPASAFRVADRDFTNYSLRGNAVLRWEWQPGSTLFLVWQQRRSGTVEDGSFEFGRDTRAIFGERADNTLVMKVNYWLSL
jgi:hypothetical protein